ncbi:MAG: hypothetical protein IJW44_04135, partial [Clostridia bacterium]|nr:hypothetical protein [Clostridia bacterium]
RKQNRAYLSCLQKKTKQAKESKTGHIFLVCEIVKAGQRKFWQNKTTMFAQAYPLATKVFEDS